MKRLFLSILIFYPTFAALVYLYDLLMEMLDANFFFGQAIVILLSTWISVYPKIKQDGRVFLLKEKLIFVLSTWGVWSVFVFIGVSADQQYMQNAMNEAGVTLPMTLFVGFYVLVAFIASWLVISTHAESYFKKILKNS